MKDDSGVYATMGATLTGFVFVAVSILAFKATSHISLGIALVLGLSGATVLGMALRKKWGRICGLVCWYGLLIAEILATMGGYIATREINLQWGVLTCAVVIFLLHRSAPLFEHESPNALKSQTENSTDA